MKTKRLWPLRVNNKTTSKYRKSISEIVLSLSKIFNVHFFEFLLRYCYARSLKRHNNMFSTLTYTISIVVVTNPYFQILNAIFATQILVYEHKIESISVVITLYSKLAYYLFAKNQYKFWYIISCLTLNRNVSVF